MNTADDKKTIAKLRQRIALSRCFPTNTCAASRHTEIMGNCLAGSGYPMLQEEPLHCAISILATVDALYRARTQLARLKRKRRSKHR